MKLRVRVTQRDEAEPESDVAWDFASTTRGGAPSARTRGTLSAEWWNARTSIGLVCAGVGAIDRAWSLVILGAGLAFVGAFVALRRLTGTRAQRAGWVAIEAVGTGAVLGLVWVGGLRHALLWIVVFVALFVPPWIATRLTGARET